MKMVTLILLKWPTNASTLTKQTLIIYTNQVPRISNIIVSFTSRAHTIT